MGSLHRTPVYATDRSPFGSSFGSSARDGRPRKDAAMAADRARHGLSRRELLRTIALAGVGLVAAACSSVPSAPAATSSPKRGGTLTWGQSADSATIDPALSSGSAATEIIGNLFDPLVSVDSSGEIRPGLATSWTIEDDAARYRFTLRDGVKFHDGTAFEADAMKRTLERILDPRTKAAQAATHLSQIAQIEAPDPRTLVVTMKAPPPLFLLSLWRPWFGPVSPKLLDALQPGDVIAAPIGTGPYKLAGRSADGVTTLEACSEYKWGPDLLRNRAAPYLASMKLRSITDASTRVSTLESGENLLVDDLPETDYGR